MKNHSKKILIYVLLALASFDFSFGQVKDPGAAALPVLTREEMFADFDQFVKAVVQISPQTPVRRAVTGIDPLRELKKMRPQIPKLRSTEEFAYFIRAAITLLQDGHSSLIWPESLTADEVKEVGISETAMRLLPIYYDFLSTAPAQKNKFNLRLKYINGEYYNVVPFMHNGTVFETGLKLIEVNGQNVHSLIGSLYPYLRMMRWDFERRRYYMEGFYKAYNFSPDGTIKLKFVDSNGKPKVSDFKLSEGLNFTNLPKDAVDQAKNVEYFADEQILYIRLPKMDLADTDFYLTEIKAKVTGKPLKKVIIDIRDNPGGADNVWIDVLKAIIKDPIVFTNYLLCNPSAEIKKKFPKDFEGWKPYRAEFLDGYEYAIFASGERRIEPTADSIKFGGKIYVLQNENVYSAAGSLLAIGALAPNIYTVGRNTGRLLGRGINPIELELPNSKILCRIEPVIDFLNVSKASDVFHDQVEIPVSLSVEDYLKKTNNPKSLYRREFLFTNDPVSPGSE